MVLTSGQIQALTTSQIASLGSLSTPIVLDLNGDGVKTLGISSGVKFDLFADGKAVQSGWVSSGDGLLVMDRNHDGQINDGSELFGSSTTLASGEKAADGYVALRELDSNKDGVISQDDAGFADLRVWVDSNSDGVTETGELKTLASLEITKIDLQASVGSESDNGNLLGLTSTYETSDGVTHAAADVWFATDKAIGATSAPLVDPVASVDTAIAALAQPNSATVENPETKVLSAVGENNLLHEVKVAVGAPDLRARVSSLAQAIGGFDGGDPEGIGFSEPKIEAVNAVVTPTTASTLAVASMADVMKQFDADGNMVGTASSAMQSASKILNLPSIQDPDATGLLASGLK
jgi:hypothetical protein